MPTHSGPAENTPVRRRRRIRRHAPRAVISLLVVLLAAAGACLAPSTTVEPAGTTPAPTVRHTAIPTPTPEPTPTPSPTPDPIAQSVVELLAARDRAQRACDGALVDAVLDLQTTAPEFRERERTLGRIVCERQGAPPERTVLSATRGAGTELGLVTAIARETDDQGRTRLVRYFVNLVGATRLSEPLAERLGPVRLRAGDGFELRYRDLDAEQAAATERMASEAIASLVARLGEAYRPLRPFTITLAPTTVAGLPAVASGFVNDRDITLLSSHSLIVESGPGSEWARRVVTHEIAHILLFQRGRGAWLLVEGIPLWLTDDRRQPELDRLIAANSLWDLAHLVDGPRDLAEFFAGYAQASAFVRYLAITYGDRAVIAAWEAGRTMPFEQAFRVAFGVGAAEAHAAWRAALRPAAACDEDLLLAA